MMRIVVVGAGGRLGAALTRTWREEGNDVRAFNRAALDLADDAAICAQLQPLDFDVLINCAAQTNVDRCETHRDEAMRLNASAVRTIGEICARKRRRCIHVSTDYVFDGALNRPYTEEDEPRPISVYGESKRAGEIALIETSERHLVVRVSWVFGPDRPSFVDAIMKRAIESENVDAIADKIAVPTYTIDAAQLLRPFLAEVPIGGVLHLCNEGRCSWQEYGQFAIDCLADAGVPLQGRTVKPLKMAELKSFVARRPPNTVMSTARLSELTGRQPRPWQVALEEYVRQYIAPHHTARSQES